MLASAVAAFCRSLDSLVRFDRQLTLGETELTAAELDFDREWNQAVQNTSSDRAFRIGPKRNVYVHQYVGVGTREEKIDEMIEHKQSLAGHVVSTGETWITELSNAEQHDLLTLRPEAVGRNISPTALRNRLGFLHSGKARILSSTRLPISPTAQRNRPTHVGGSHQMLASPGRQSTGAIIKHPTD